jgi:hypothetical protein
MTDQKQTEQQAREANRREHNARLLRLIKAGLLPKDTKLEETSTKLFCAFGWRPE